MLQAIKKAFKIDSTNDQLHTCIIRFYCFIRDHIDSKSEIIRKVVEEETESIFCKMSAQQINDRYLSDFQYSLSKVLQGAKMMYYLEPSSQRRVFDILLNFNHDYWTDLTYKVVNFKFKIVILNVISVSF